MRFNEKLFELRKQKGYSQEELADKLDVARQTISKWESGITTPDFDNLIKLSKIFDISIDDFVGNNYKKELLKEENLKKENRKQIVLKIFLILLIVILIVLVVKIIKRYKIVDVISDNLIYTYNSGENRITEFNYVYNVSEFERMEHKSYTCVDTYCKNNILKIEHKVADINPNLKSNDINVVRVEYIDGDNYYDIDMINKTYTKEPFDRGEIYYYDKTGKELDYIFFDEYNFDLYGVLGILNKFSIAIDFRKDIDKKYVEEAFYNYENYIIDNGNLNTPGKNNIDVTMSFFIEKSIPSISLSKTKYLDDSKGNLIIESYHWYGGEVTGKNIAIPDLTDFTLIENN